MPKLPGVLSVSIQFTLSAIIIGGGVLGLVVLRASRSPTERVTPETFLPRVEVAPVQYHTAGIDIEVDGTVVPSREWILSAEVAGRVVFKHKDCRAGHFIEHGTKLLEIDPTDYQLAVDRWTKELEQANRILEETDQEIKNLGLLRGARAVKADLLSLKNPDLTAGLIPVAERQLYLQELEYQRQQRLRQRDVISQSELEQAAQALLSSRTALQQLLNQKALLRKRLSRQTATRDLARVQRDQAQADLDRCTIYAPRDGLIVSDGCELDTYVKAGAEMITIEDTSEVEVATKLKLSQLYWIWSQPQQMPGLSPEELAQLNRDYELPPTAVTIRYELAGKEFRWEGTLKRFEGIGVDERTRTAACRVVVPHRDKPRMVSKTTKTNPPSDKQRASQPSSSPESQGLPALVRGMYVHLTIHAQPAVRLLAIPRAALQPDSTVWLARELEDAEGKSPEESTLDQLSTAQGVQARIRRVAIDPIYALAEAVLIYAEGSPLEPGSRLVTSPLGAATDGAEVILTLSANDKSQAARAETNRVQAPAQDISFSQPTPVSQDQRRSGSIAADFSQPIDGQGGDR